MPFGPGFALNFVERIFFLSSRFTWKAFLINFNFVRETRQCKFVHNGFRKKFLLKVFFVWGYFHILFYITSYTFLYIKCTFMTSESFPVSYIIAIATCWTKSVKFTLSIAVHTGVLAKNQFWPVATQKKRIGEQLKEKSRRPLLARAALNAASLGCNW